MYKEIDGDLIELALAGSFDVIAHGCNCFCLQGAGIALQMCEVFNTNTFLLESSGKGFIDKLGCIDSETIRTTKVINGRKVKSSIELTVVNAYTQYQPGANLDYEALTLCLRKMNHEFKGKHIGLPQIGCGIAGGDWNVVKLLIKQELKDCDVTVVIYNK